MFTELGSEFILVPLLVVLKVFLILFYCKHFAKGTLNGWEVFCLVLFLFFLFFWWQQKQKSECCGLTFERKGANYCYPN